jgi:hypothetical protein
MKQIDYTKLSLAELELLKLKLFGKALRAFPSSPRQKAIHSEIEKVFNAITKLT